MAIPASPESKQILEHMFKKAMKPIWPNLVKRETKMDYIVRRPLFECFHNNNQEQV